MSEQPQLIEKAQRWLENAWNQETTRAERITLVDLIIQLHRTYAMGHLAANTKEVAQAIDNIAGIMEEQVAMQAPMMTDDEVTKSLYDHP